MKANDPTDQNHRHTINRLVNKDPAERAEKQLQSVRKHGHRERKDDSRRVSFGARNIRFNLSGSFIGERN